MAYYRRSFDIRHACGHEKTHQTRQGERIDFSFERSRNCERCREAAQRAAQIDRQVHLLRNNPGRAWTSGYSGRVF